MITRAAKAWHCIMPVGRVMDGPMAARILPKGNLRANRSWTSSNEEGGHAFDCWTPEEGLSRGCTYGRIEDAHYARKVEIRSRNNGSSDQTIGCSTFDEFVRLTLDLRGRQHRAWATPLPNAQEQCGAMDAVYG